MKIRSRSLNLIIAFTAALMLRLLFLTVHWQHHHVVPDGTPYRPAQGRRRFTFCLWHDAIVLCVFGHRTFELSGLISQHTDGGYLADAARFAGILPVRGSTTRGGAGAVRKLLDLPRMHLAITPDGPQGPRRKLKDGLVFLASRADRPVIPTGLAVSHAWKLQGRWTDLLIPKPFSKLVAIAGPPIEIPADLERDQTAPFLERIDAEMTRLDVIAHRVLNGDQTVLEFVSREGHYPPGCQPEQSRSQSGEQTLRRAA